MNYKIVADSSSNVFELSGVDYAHVPLKILNQGVEYVDVPGLDVFGMLDAMKASREGSSTSCPNVYEWKEAFGDAEAVFAVTITSNLSGSYAAARTAAEDYMEEHPGRRVSVIDTLSVGPEAHLVLDKLVELMAQGLEFDEIDKQVRDYLKTTRLCFSLESIENLARNGRCSMAVAKLVGVMGIRIVGRASDEGTLQQLHKCRGEKKALETILAEMEAHGFTGGKVRINHAHNPAAAQALHDLVKSKYPDIEATITPMTGLCCFYAERGSVMIGFEG